MAKIITNRPECAQYNGRDAVFVRDVVDGPAFNKLVDQVVVSIDGKDLYFFANEVILTPEEEDVAEEGRDNAAELRDKQAKRSDRNRQGKRELFAKSQRKAAEDAEPPEPPASPAPPPEPPSAPVAGEGAPQPVTPPAAMETAPGGPKN